MILPNAPSSLPSIQSLQQYDWREKSVNQIIEYLRDNKFPKKLTRRQWIRFVDKYRKHFYVKEVDGVSTLYYRPRGLRVVPSDNKAAKERILMEVYKSPEALGKGQSNFHQLVLLQHLGLNRNDTTEFLRRQPEYQLFQSRSKLVNKSLQPRHPLHYVAIDLVDLQSLAGSNYKHKFIFTAVDLFSNYAWFYPMILKDANKTLEHNLKLQTPRAQEKMRQKNVYDYPVVTLSDEGSEFSKQFEDFLRVHGIKKRTTESYTPQPNVEATNNVLRNLLRAQFIKSGTLALRIAIVTWSLVNFLMMCW
jgi:hypothetical protein